MTTENQKIVPPEMSKTLDKFAGIIKQNRDQYLSIDPLEIIAVQKRLEDFSLEGEEITLSDGTNLRIRDVLDHEHTDAFVRGWKEFSETDIFKRIWLRLRKGEVDKEIGDLSPTDELTLVQARQQIKFWLAYYSMRDYNEKLRSLPPEVAVDVIKRHPMATEICGEILKRTSASEEGQAAIKGFREE